MHVAVTGATGFIGRRTLNKLLERGHKVHALSRKRNNSSIKNLSWFQGDLVHSPDNLLSQFLGGCDVIVHCAGEITNEKNMHDLHIMGTQRILDLSPPSLKHWIQISSCGVYGPLRDGLIDESHPVNPLGLYEVTKYESESMVWDAAQQYGFSCNILRPSTVYSLDMPNNSLRSFISAIRSSKFFFVGKPGAIYNYVHVDDVVDAITHCLHNETSAHYNLSQDCTIEEFVSTICTLLDRKPITLRLPVWLVKSLISLINPFFKTPLSHSRIEALTARTNYLGGKITRETKFTYNIKLTNGLSELTRQSKETR